jgi:hypothetical protein
MEYLDRLLKDFQEKQTKENIQSHPEWLFFDVRVTYI